MDQIVIEWDREHILAAMGRIVGGRASMESVASIPRGTAEQGVDAQNSHELAARLRDLFPAGSSKSPLPVTILLPRQSVTIHRIALPLVPDAELADIVRLQASMKLTVPLESVSLDFAPLPIVPGNSTRDVLLVTTPSEQINSIRKTLTAANLQVKAVRATSFCIAAAAIEAGLLAPQADYNHVDAIVLLRADFIEVTFTKGHSVVFSHSGASWGSSNGIEKAVRSELVRARMAAAEMLGEHRIGRVLLLGQKEITSNISDDISSKVDGARIERIDPTSRFFDGQKIDNVAPELLVAIAGAIYADVNKKVEAIDLINPRRPPEKKDLTRVRILGGALAALLVFALVWNWRQGQMKDLSASLEALRSSTTDLQDAVKLGKPDQELAQLIGDWVDRDVNWLDELQGLQQLLPGTDRFLIKDIKFDVKQGSDIGTIRLDGRAKSAADIEQIARRLSDFGYIVQPYTPEPSQRDPGYPYSISMNLVIPKRSAAPAATSLTNPGRPALIQA